jgi:uncharacterized protein (TIGR02996 family)
MIQGIIGKVILPLTVSKRHPVSPPMTDNLNLLLRAIIENKDGQDDDDTLRLAYADELDEIGGKENNERAEFIRVQCELEQVKTIKISESDALVLSADRELRDYMSKSPHSLWMMSEYGLPEYIFGFRVVVDPSIPDQGYRTLGHFQGVNNPEIYIRLNELVEKSLAYGDQYVVGYQRGFQYYITYSSQDFFKVADSLIWHPSQTVLGEDKKTWIPRPCPPTAQPIRKVKLTDTPDTKEVIGEHHDSYNAEIILSGQCMLGETKYQLKKRIRLRELDLRDRYRQEFFRQQREGVKAELHPRVLLPKRYPGVVFELPYSSLEGTEDDIMPETLSNTYG